MVPQTSGVYNGGRSPLGASAVAITQMGAAGSSTRNGENASTAEAQYKSNAINGSTNGVTPGSAEQGLEDGFVGVPALADLPASSARLGVPRATMLPRQEVTAANGCFGG